MDVVTKVLEQVVGINWRTLAVRFVALASSSQSFWQNDTSESWGDRGSKRDLFLIRMFVFCHIHIRDVIGKRNISYFSWWVSFFAFSIHTYIPFLLFACAGLVMTKGYFVFNIKQTSHTVTLTCKNWAIIMNVDLRTMRIFHDLTRVCGMTTPLTKQYFRLEVIGLNLTDIPWPENSNFLPSLEAFFAEFNSAYSSIFFRTVLYRYSPLVIQFSLILLGWGIWTPSMLNLLRFAFKISFSHSSWLYWIGKSNFCAKITFSIKFA